MNRYNFFWAQMISIPFLILFVTVEYVTAIVSDPKKSYVEKITPHLVKMNNEKRTQYAVVVEKSTQQVFLYAYDGTFREVFRFTSSTGENHGPKTRSGDRKTPEGVYFFTDEYEDRYLSEIYGTRAFPLDYPNLRDKIAGHTGNAIWMHGTNKPLKPYDSNGCIALANKDIDRLAPYIRLNETPIIIVDELKSMPLEASAPALSQIQTSLESWTQALSKGSYHDFLALYSDGYLPDISWWPHWYKLRKEHQANNRNLMIRQDNLLIFKHKDVYTILFDLYIFLSSDERFVARKKIFYQMENNAPRIIGEEYQFIPKPKNRISAKAIPEAKEPLLAQAYQIEIAEKKRIETAEKKRIETAEKKRIEIAEKKRIETAEKKRNLQQNIHTTIDAWLSAWSSKDITRYGTYYAQDFRSQAGVSRRSWLRYKNGLNQKYNYIRVTQKKLVITRKSKMVKASFIQTYTSDKYKAVGIKKLLLKKENGRWKIYRETWKKI